MSASTELASHSPSRQKIALITGGSRGLGRATALSMAEAGTDVIITYRTGQGAADDVVRAVAALGRTAVALQLDTGDAASFGGFANDVKQILDQQWQRTDFDHLVNNAGTSLNAPFATTTEADFDALVAVHFKGPYFLTQTMLPLLADGGAVVNLSTGLTRFVAEGQSAYAAAKGAIDVLTKYQAKELGPRGIRVNAVAPGPIGTDFAGGIMRDNAEFRAMLAGNAALGRVGEPADIGGAITALLSDGNRWMTGQWLEVSGGTLL